MANVQTVSTPQTGLSGAPLSITPPPDAFGANVVGEGLKDLGGAEAQVSDMFEKRALTIQAINNQNSADAGNMEYAQRTAATREKYKNDLMAALAKNPGIDTTAYLGSYLKQNEQDRNEIAAKMGNPMATQMFHQESRRLSSLNAGQLAAETSTAWREATVNSALQTIVLNQGIAIGRGADTSHPDVQAAMFGIWQQVQKVAALRGWSPDAQKAEFQKSVSPIFEDLFEKKIIDRDLTGAQAVLTQHAAHDLTPEAMMRMQKALRVGVSQNAIQSPISDIYDKGIAPTAPGNSGLGASMDDRAFYKAFTAPHEGAQTVIDVNGAKVQYGINKEYNPDADVGNLTLEQAADIYQAKYATKRTDLSPALRNAYNDTRFMSPAKADEFLKESGGDVNKFIDLREQYQASLAAANPAKYGRVAAGWHNRSEELRAFVGGAGGTTFSEAPPKFAANADPSEIKNTMLLFNQRAAMALYPQSAEDRARFLAGADQRAGLMAEVANTGQMALFNQAHKWIHDGLPSGNAVHTIDDLPATLVSQLSPEYRTKVEDQITYAREGIGGYKTPAMEANAQALLTLSGTNKVAFINTDLQKVPLAAQDFMRLAGLKASLQRNEQAAQDRATKVNALVNNPFVKNIIDNEFGQIGKPFSDARPTPGGDWVKSPGHMSFLGALEGEVERAQAQMPAGKKLSDEEVGKIAHNLLLQQKFENNPDYVYITNDFKDYLIERYRQQYNAYPSPEEFAYFYHKMR